MADNITPEYQEEIRVHLLEDANTSDPCEHLNVHGYARDLFAAVLSLRAERDAARAEVAALKAENEALKAAFAESATDQLLREGLHDNAVEVERILARVLRVPEGSRLIDEWGELAEAALAASVPREVALKAAELAFEDGWDEGSARRTRRETTHSDSREIARLCLESAEAMHTTEDQS